MGIYKHVMTVGEVASYLNLSQATLYRMVNSGRFPLPHKIGRRSVWSRAEVSRWVATSLAIPIKEVEADIEVVNGV